MFVSDAILHEQVRRFQQQSRLLSVVPSRYLEQLSRPKQRFLVEETKKKSLFCFLVTIKNLKCNPPPPFPFTLHIFHRISF